MSKNDRDTFYDTLRRHEGTLEQIMRGWYWVSIAYRAIMVILFLAAIAIIANDLITSSGQTSHPVPERHGIAALSGTVVPEAG